MASIAEFQSRAIERLEEFRQNTGVLPGLVYARYVTDSVSTLSGKVKNIAFALRKNKKHVMHSQHRNNCVDVIKFLIMHMDIRSRRCVKVNQRHKIRRNLYVPEIAQRLGLCDRTVTRVLGSLERGRYLVRSATPSGSTMFLTLNLFRDLRISVVLERLASQLAGLEKIKAKWPGFNGSSKKKAPSPSPAVKPAIISQCEKTPPNDGECLTSRIASREIANSFLNQMKGLRRRKPPP